MADLRQTRTGSVNDAVPTLESVLSTFIGRISLCFLGLNLGVASPRELAPTSGAGQLPCLRVPITPWVFLHLSFNLKREKQVNKCFQDFH